jgi:hypothetical protein
LIPSPNEIFSPFAVLLTFAFAAALTAAFFGFTLLAEFLKRSIVTSTRRRRFTVVCVAAAIALLASSRLAYAASSAGERVILSACRALRVPDPASAPSAEFAEGQAARASARTGKGQDGWLFIELDDGRSGWIEAVHARRY